MSGLRPDGPAPGGRQARFERLYATERERFAGPPSAFADWVGPVLDAEGIRSGRWIDLGCGLGRDARRFAARGFEVLAVDFATTAIARARADPANPPTLRFEAKDAVAALRGQPTGSLTVVYAHAVYMLLHEEALSDLLREIPRVLRGGGLHLFAVRATTDPAAPGVGLAPAGGPGPDSTPVKPAVPPYRFFGPESVDRLTAETGLVRRRAEHQGARHFWYVADRRP